METVLEQPKQRKKNSILRATSSKSPAIKNEIIARRSQGQAKAVIARALDIAPNTVSSIVALSGIDSMLEDGRLSVARLIPKSVNVMDERLDRCSETAAIAILRGTGVLKTNEDVNINLALNVSNSWYVRRSEPNNANTLDSRASEHVVDALPAIEIPIAPEPSET